MYKLIEGFDGVLRLADGATLPSEPTLSAWQEYQDWLAAGNTPLHVAPEPILIPQIVTRAQGRQALLSAGMLDRIEAYMADPATPRADKLAWEDIQDFRRDSPLLIRLADMLGLTDKQIDELFIAADKVVI